LHAAQAHGNGGDGRRFHASFGYQAATWAKPRRVIAKFERRPREHYPRIGFTFTKLPRPAERVVALYNQRGTAEQRMKEGNGAIRWTPLSCRSFAADAVRLQLHAIACNLGNFLRTPATPEPSTPASRASARNRGLGKDRALPKVCLLRQSTSQKTCDPVDVGS
jgi:hypothetical protein